MTTVDSRFRLTAGGKFADRYGAWGSEAHSKLLVTLQDDEFFAGFRDG